MAVDNSLFKRLAEEQVRNRLAKERVAESDFVEAKANALATRIVESNPALEEKYEIEREDGYYDSEEVEASYDRFEMPPKEESGLVSDSLVPDESQYAAVEMLTHEQYGCLIGAAGTGKTTTTKLLLQRLIYGDDFIEPMNIRKLDGKQGLSIAMCAFTGIATQVIKQNMPEWLHPCCKTIHSLLEYSPVETVITDKATGGLKETMVFMPMRDAHNKLQHDIIIIDEASMVGVDLWHQILDALYDGTRIFLIGDLNQLPPVVSQSMFAYTLADWKVAELTHVHRQKEPAANKIIEVAHSILQGVDFTMDDPATNHNWRVIGLELDPSPDKAGVQIVALANQLRAKRVHESVDPESPLIYDPLRDRIITAGNGYDETNPNSAVQQFIINDALSRLIEPPSPDHPRIIIDAGMSKKTFATHHRVMATRNESPDTVDRVTNGMVGVILEINRNHGWSGDPRMVGPEEEVREYNNNRVKDFFSELRGGDKNTDDVQTIELPTLSQEGFDAKLKASREGGSPASHSVTVEFQNGATRTFTSKNQVASLMLAYASTCHKCQGSQMDTAIIVCHHAAKSQLCREWLYTAVTRAQKRVVFLYTKHGLRVALARQKIFGRTLAEKIKKYQDLQEETSKIEGLSNLKQRVRLRIEDR